MFQWLAKVEAWWRRRSSEPGSGPRPLRVLQRIILSDGVARTLLEDFAEHRRSERGNEEIGWILLGLRREDEAIVLAALPAGTRRDASTCHVRFDADVQELTSRIIRQQDRRLQIIGVVHTHPGSLHAPSEGDFQGDRDWVGQLRGAEGAFGIGTADAGPTGANVHGSGDLHFSWYALAAGDDDYRPLPVQTRPGPDLAAPLRLVWDVIESHASPLNRLCRHFARVQLEILNGGPTPLLSVQIGLAEENQQLRVLLSERHARYYLDRRGELVAIDPCEPRLDRAVYLILAELAKEPAGMSAALVEA